MSDLPEIVVIAGPTASGKTALGIEIAGALNGEIISADARQVYRWMDIGTAKPTVEEQQAAPHHLIDVVNPDEPYSAGQFAQDGASAIEDILQRGRVPILVGGSGLYLKALLEGFSPVPDVPADLRSKVQEEAGQDLSGLYSRLQELDPEWAEKVHPNDTQRIVRGIEVFEAVGKKLSDFQKMPGKPAGNWRARWFGLSVDREQLYDRINLRAERMVEQGLIEEIRRLKERGFHIGLNALNTFGYREMFDFLEGRRTLEEALGEIQQGSRRYAKRQMTWFRGLSQMTWIEPEAALEKVALKLASREDLFP